MYTIDLINDGWQINGDHYENILVVSDKNGDDIDAVVRNICEFITLYYTDNSVNVLDDDEFAKMLAKVKPERGIPPSEYVANKVGYVYHSVRSFYDGIEINIELSPGNIQKGIIRISDHEVDLDEWTRANQRYDFGISFVLKEKSTEWQGSNIVEVPNRQILICEFTYIVSRKQLSLLDYLVSEILNIKQTKQFISSTVIAGKVDKKVSNYLIESISNAVKKALLTIKKY